MFSLDFLSHFFDWVFCKSSPWKTKQKQNTNVVLEKNKFFSPKYPKKSWNIVVKFCKFINNYSKTCILLCYLLNLIFSTNLSQSVFFSTIQIFVRCHKYFTPSNLSNEASLFLVFSFKPFHFKPFSKSIFEWILNFVFKSLYDCSHHDYLNWITLYFVQYQIML